MSECLIDSISIDQVGISKMYDPATRGLFYGRSIDGLWRRDGEKMTGFGGISGSRNCSGNFKVFIGRMPRRAEAGDVVMTSFSIRHLSLVQPMLRDMGWSGSTLLTWWRLRRLFAFLYFIEILGRPAGILGVYNFKPCASAEISLVIFDKALRHRGYGKKIFSLAASILSRHASVKRLTVMVDPDNTDALSFWTALGFRDDGRQGNNQILGLDLKDGCG